MLQTIREKAPRIVEDDPERTLIKIDPETTLDPVREAVLIFTSLGDRILTLQQERREIDRSRIVARERSRGRELECWDIARRYGMLETLQQYVINRGGSVRSS